MLKITRKLTKLNCFKNGLSDEKRKKKIICKYSLFKECFKTNIIPLDLFQS